MPGGDGTGPMGMGSMTGRAAGFCAGYGVPGYMNPMPVQWGGAWNAAPGYVGAIYSPYSGAVSAAHPRAYAAAPRFGRSYGHGYGFGRRAEFGRSWGRGWARAPYGHAW
ncbi:MAG: DUF5320 domain-containing protein [Victivallales bacterium]|nr:DUF5320 domain-containing protein [Victivallales bacterium]